ncbi:ThiF family adenylyltransferase [Bradyrhizobium sp. CCGE-LA001]|uniref:ThiF family adenylyltransferase n=1 Tax=Bradyrhizobium sp. CCGE-LA001 TaxID=1223566 RepID=UPI0002AAD430|nr:ThiF family adenylyltransferase [Bradyrhizobium sp. CCGE-LA001]AMA60124.1 hypothetical protein BCCGELA001_30430 [Bradyrhizobium sp. CCGE-LA001]
MWWYLADLGRFKSERLGLEALAASADWLTPLGWRTDDTKRLIFEADITIGARTYPVYLSYPSHFPHTPPSVYPRGDQTTLWSNHQFGPGGELCLEYRPDNWTSDITGAMLLESAHRLLFTENPAEGEAERVPSAHEVSLGQTLRTRNLRMLLTRGLMAFFAGMKTGEMLKSNMLVLCRPETNVYVIDKVTKSDGEVWTDPDVPLKLGSETFERSAPILRIERTQALPPTTSVADFKAATKKLGFDEDAATIVILRGDKAHCYFAYGEYAGEAATIPPEPVAHRLDESHERLRGMSAALIGCGSLGSKVAAMLARSGVGNFYLVDDDLLLPDNLVRHDLDWRDVGTHKVDAVAQRIKNVNPDAKVHVRKVRMAGQESSGSAETAITSLLARDVIVNATANPSVFNLVAAVAESDQKPVVWAEVFGGGFGGLMARYRPGKEPSPQLMRRAIENWFAERGYQPKTVTRDYGTGGDGPPMIADDADVASIAAATARLAIDTLLAREPSYFPVSAYVLGLAPEDGLFTQAFETFPVPMPESPPQEIPFDMSAEEATAEIVEIAKIFDKQ